MNSKLLLVPSAILLGAAGVVANFMPQEIAGRLGLTGLPAGALLVQLLAGLLIAFALLNWMCRDHRVGGIYGKPLALANALQFAVGAFGLGRAVTGPLQSPLLWAAFAFYVLFALGFLWLVFGPAPSDVAVPAELRS
jgi:hypothetical protein